LHVWPGGIVPVHLPADAPHADRFAGGQDGAERVQQPEGPDRDHDRHRRGHLPGGLVAPGLAAACTASGFDPREHSIVAATMAESGGTVRRASPRTDSTRPAWSLIGPSRHPATG
jgi:hypothetical protein